MSNVIMWQFTDRLKLPGVGVALDGNYWLKSERELLESVQKPPVAEEPEPEPIVIPQPAPAEPVEAPTLPSQPTETAPQQSQTEPEDIIIPAQTEPAQTAPVQEITPDMMEDPVLVDSTPSSPPDTLLRPSSPPAQPAAPLTLWEIIQRFIRALFTSFSK